MQNKLKKIIFSVSKIGITFALLFSQKVWAQDITTGNPLLGEKTAGKIQRLSAYFADRIGFNVISLPGIIALLIFVVLAVLSILFIALVFYGGYKWMMARGNEQQVEDARAIIRQAIIGLIVLLASYAFGYFILYYLITGGAGQGAPSTPYN